MSKMKKQTQKMATSANSQRELLALLVNFTEQAEAKTTKAAKFQEMTLTQIVEIAESNGRPTGGCSLGDTILVQQHHRIVQWGDKAFCLSEKQMQVIVRENWDYLK